MNNDEKKLDALTGQSVTISLGGRQYQARRATLYDVGVMNRKRKELQDSGDTANIEMDVAVYTLYTLIKDENPGMAINSYEDLLKSIPFASFNDVIIALETTGFKLPQTQQKKEETGA